VGQRPILDQAFQMLPVDAVLDCTCQPCADFWLIPVSDGFDQQLTQGLPFELEFAQYIEYLTA
jgi:hypothetical protein